MDADDALDLPYWIQKLDDWNRFLCTVPLPQEYRERTTFIQFWDEMRPKREAMGLTEEVMTRLHQVKDSPDLDWAFTEIGMTVDNREMITTAYYDILPMNFYWMPEYEPVIAAVEAHMGAQPLYTGVTDEVLLEIVKRHMSALTH